MGSGRRARAVAGTAGAAPSTPAGRPRGRVLARPGLTAGVAGVVLVLLLGGGLAAILLGGNSASAARGRSAVSFGGLPGWLPKARTPVGQTLRASRAHPALAVQGESVSVHLARGRVLATAVGPSVPEDGRFPVPARSPCTFVVTFAAASGVVPLDPRAFAFVDDLGHLRHPRLTTLAGGRPPRQILPARTLSVRVHAVLPTGNGGLTWAPGGWRPIVSWDFDVEID
ncbi:MAG TPA: hypothetical protein VND98_07065 [Solirubrobacterales bacterium]|nr:hypothetical protein [Solirubrobacterales bacterium]